MIETTAENPITEYPAKLVPTESGGYIQLADGTVFFFFDLAAAIGVFMGTLSLEEAECAIAGPNPGPLHIYSNQEI